MFAISVGAPYFAYSSIARAQGERHDPVHLWTLLEWRAMILVRGKRNPQAMEDRKTLAKGIMDGVNEWAEGRHYNLSIPVEDYLALLGTEAVTLVVEGTNGLCCDACNARLTFWWDQSNALPREERILMQRLVKQVTGGLLPEAPWEEVA